MFRPVLKQASRSGSRRMQSTKPNLFEAMASQMKNNKNTNQSNSSRNDKKRKDNAEINRNVMKSLFSGIGDAEPVYKSNRNNNRNDRIRGGDNFRNNNNNRFNNRRDGSRQETGSLDENLLKSLNTNRNSGPSGNSSGNEQRFNRGDTIRGNLSRNSGNSQFQQRGQKFGNNASKPYQKGRDNQSNRWRKSEPERPVIPKWETGTDLEKTYMNELLKTVYETNPEGDIKFITETGEIEDASVSKYFDLVPAEKVMGIVNFQEDETTQQKFAVIKFFDRVTRLKQFSDDRAKILTAKFGRTRESKRKDQNLKHVKVTWEISQSDLDNQKTNEIIGHLNKGHKLQIVIGEKDGMDKSVFDVFKSNPSETEDSEIDELEELEYERPLSNLEERRRIKVLDQIKSIFDEKATIDVKGKITKRIAISAKPLEKKEEKKEEVKNSKDEKKLARQEKERQRLEKKKAKEEEKKRKAAEFLKTLEN